MLFEKSFYKGVDAYFTQKLIREIEGYFLMEKNMPSDRYRITKKDEGILVEVRLAVATKWEPAFSTIDPAAAYCGWDTTVKLLDEGVKWALERQRKLVERGI